jgi:hypothetical protein
MTSSRRKPSDQRPIVPDAARVDEPIAETAQEPVAGLVVDGTQSRSGEDTRRRGWFWHWNATVTQYAPLIGLKGVGLLNSYTVWTDRREESPHRGYAFPSQQSEADFYGEDRAELITINKILVALDLIEIRKEMVLRVDEAGRRWRVPHNLYRVKDRDDGFTLTAREVQTIVELAARDKAVYRYIRHIFSPKFRPIDANNVWTGILETLQDNPTWQTLAGRAAAEDARASARTKAGHASRRAGTQAAPRRAGKSEPPPSNDSSTVEMRGWEETSVASTNKGSGINVAPANKGFGQVSPSSVAPANDASPTSVELTNTTYHQHETTTTTSGDGVVREIEHEAATAPEAVPTPESSGPGGHEAPVDRAGQEAAFQSFYEANHREPTIAERKLLRDLAERFDPPARACPVPGYRSGWQWVSAAIVDAVDAGSAFVAPRRVREILLRWEREGIPGSNQDSRERGNASMTKAGGVGQVALGRGPVVDRPHGRDSVRTWETVVRSMGEAIGAGRLADLFEGTAIAGVRGDEIVVLARDEAQVARLTGEYHALLTRKVSEALRRPVTVAVTVLERGSETTPAKARSEHPIADEVAIGTPVFVLPGTGLSNAQVWQAVLEDLQRAGSAGRANIEAWLRPVVILDWQADGTVVLGAPNALVRRRVQERFGRVLEGALGHLLGSACRIETVVTGEWLAGRSREGKGEDKGGASEATA